MPKFSKKSLERLSTCNHLLQYVANKAIKEMDFVVVCGHRGKKEQDEAYMKGFSKLKFPESKHNKLPSLAMDLAPCKVVNGKTTIDWTDIKAFQDLAKIIKRIADDQFIPIEWGGDWKGFKDMPHFQLNLN
jgi:peptidoglycan L-alanyl-D-glutamate endopeptidase CwlK